MSEEFEDTQEHFLQFKVYKWSSYSSKYVPENILHNKPNQQSSRWSSATNYPPQFLFLKLTKPAIIKTIIFGKYEKTHVCNLKKFKIYGGMEENNLIEILQGGLKNDHHPETFELKHKIDGQTFPCLYIKIVPILSWGQSFNFSIWYVELRGLNSEKSVQSCLKWYYKHREQEAIRLCLKHFRQHNYTEAFESLQKKTKISLEHPLLTGLHDQLVKNGNFEECEALIHQALKEGLFNDFVGRQEYQAHWDLIQSKCDTPSIPAKRGGHQMCLDYINNKIYLFGGWDGHRDLADLWVFSVTENMWTCLSQDTEQDGGPSARSCHKICINCRSGKIYTLGRYLDNEKRTPTAVQNDFHVYDINENKWTLISKDVSKNDGPRLLFDHQMCFDTEKQDIFVFGGRIISSHSFSLQNERMTIEFGGLYKYHVPDNTWHLLREDSGNAGPQDVRSRNGHSMLFDKNKRLLYVIGGQRGKEYLNDFFVYDIDKDLVTIINDGTNKENSLPPAGFTQRATINYELGEIHVLVGLSKDKEKHEENNMHNSFWVYNIEENIWICFYTNELASEVSSNSDKRIKSLSSLEPCPRYAHQLVYNHKTKTHFMFGGNPGNRNNKSIRLNDFWSLRIFRLRNKDILRKCIYMIRCHHFKEKASKEPIAAIQFLQTKLYESVNHDNPAESQEFRRLASFLFGGNEDESEEHLSKTQSSSFSSLLSVSPTPSTSVSLWNLRYTEVDDAYAGRTKLYDSIVSFFPEEMVQPKENLVDLITF